MNLTELKTGERATIKCFESSELELKLMEMGCIPGEEVSVEQTAPLGGPISIRVAGYSLSLRKNEAAQIIFLPSALLVLFFFPIWTNLKKYAAIYRSLEGINAAVVGIMVAATLYIMKDVSLLDARLNSFINIAVIAATFLLLQFTRIASPLIVIACLLLGYLL